MKKVIILLVVAALFLGGCSGMSNTQQRVLSGGAIRRQQRRSYRLGGRFAGGRRGHRRRCGYVGRFSLRPVRKVSRPTLIRTAPGLSPARDGRRRIIRPLCPRTLALARGIYSPG